MWHACALRKNLRWTAAGNKEKYECILFRVGNGNPPYLFSRVTSMKVEKLKYIYGEIKINFLKI